MTKLLTVIEAAEQLRLSRSQIYQLIRDGELHAIAIGKSRRITPQALDEFIAARTGRPQAIAV